MDERSVRAWVRRHPAAARVAAAFDLTNAAIDRAVAEYRREHPDATLAEVRAHVRRRRNVRP